MESVDPSKMNRKINGIDVRFANPSMGDNDTYLAAAEKTIRYLKGDAATFSPGNVKALVVGANASIDSLGKISSGFVAVFDKNYNNLAAIIGNDVCSGISVYDIESPSDPSGGARLEAKIKESSKNLEHIPVAALDYDISSGGVPEFAAWDACMGTGKNSVSIAYSRDDTTKAMIFKVVVKANNSGASRQLKEIAAGGAITIGDLYKSSEYKMCLGASFCMRDALAATAADLLGVTARTVRHEYIGPDGQAKVRLNAIPSISSCSFNVIREIDVGGDKVYAFYSDEYQGEMCYDGIVCELPPHRGFFILYNDINSLAPNQAKWPKEFLGMFPVNTGSTFNPAATYSGMPNLDIVSREYVWDGPIKGHRGFLETYRDADSNFALMQKLLGRQQSWTEEKLTLITSRICGHTVDEIQPKEYLDFNPKDKTIAVIIGSQISHAIIENYTDMAGANPSFPTLSAIFKSEERRKYVNVPRGIVEAVVAILDRNKEGN